MRNPGAIAFGLCLALGTAAYASDESFTAEGVVVAVQKAKDDARIADPHSMGDIVEVWMVYFDKWPRTKKPRFILIEYTHHDPIVRDRELDSTVWRFEISPAPTEQSGTCMSWWTQTFVPTAMGANQKLPPPKELGCFLMQKRPIALRSGKKQQGNPITPTTQ
jgi:hypothetical protein